MKPLAHQATKLIYSAFMASGLAACAGSPGPNTGRAAFVPPLSRLVETCTLDNNNNHTAYLQADKTLIQTQAVTDEYNRRWINQVDVLMPWNNNGDTSFQKVIVQFTGLGQYQFTNVGSNLANNSITPVSLDDVNAAVIVVAKRYRPFAAANLEKLYKPCDIAKPEIKEALLKSQTFDSSSSSNSQADNLPDYAPDQAFVTAPVWIIERPHHYRDEAHRNRDEGPQNRHQAPHKTRQSTKPAPAPAS